MCLDSIHSECLSHPIALEDIGLERIGLEHVGLESIGLEHDEIFAIREKQ